ncbi:tetratricopeptide repeat protein [Flavobacteriales bacterium AH-315-E23]|nr:tetratricopeptide repeat protein [Flavobacteriales bacterium AH-315-E23]
MRSLAIISFLFLSIASFAQQGKIDSLTTRLQEDLHDSDRVNTLNSLAWELTYANPDTAIILVSEAVSIAEALSWQLAIANSIGHLGTFNVLKGRYTKALEYYFKALNIDKELGNKDGIAKHLGNIGIVYTSQGDYPKALEYYFKALRMNEQMGNINYVTAILGNIGNVYKNQSDYPKALEYYFRALNMYEELDRRRGISISLGNIGDIYRNQGDFPKALEYLFKALRMNQELENKSNIAAILGSIGNIYRNQGDSASAVADDSLAVVQTYYRMALEYYFKSMDLSEELGDKGRIALNLGNIGSLYTKTGEFEKAEIHLQKALILSKEIGAKEYLKSQYKYLSNLYDTLNRPTLAFEAYKLYIIYRDSIDNEENTKAQTRTEMKYEYEKAELMKEQEEREAARVEAETLSRRDNLQYSIVLICLLVIGGVVSMLGRLSLSARAAEGLIFFSFLIFFEFILVLADPYIEGWSGGAPGIKLLFNAGIAALIFPMHAFFEARLKGRLVRQ